MKKIIILVILLLILSLPFFWWKRINLPVNPQDKTQQVFVIPQGWGISQIGSALQKQGLIKNSLAFKIIVFKLGIQNKIQAGDYYLNPGMNLSQISEAFTHGTLDLWVTIPEGLRKEEIALIIQKSFKKAEVEFDEEEFIKLAKNLEGYLFPDTYLIPKKSSPQNVIDILTNTFEQKYSTLNNQSTLRKEELVILASLIEREAKTQEDRALVAGIMLKRLKNDWPLQVDASSQYVKANTNHPPAGEAGQSLITNPSPNWWPKVNSEDLEIASSYNTYLNKGLPETAICNPSLDSLMAVANSKNSQYWYYLSDNKGQIHYAKTLEEQDENIEKYLNAH